VLELVIFVGMAVWILWVLGSFLKEIEEEEDEI